MKLYGKYARRSYNEQGNIEVTFELSKAYEIPVSELAKGESYRIDVEQRRPHRTEQQNRYMWALIHDIAEKRNGRANTENEWDVYVQALEQAGAKYQILTCVPQAEQMLKDSFRAVQKVATTMVHDRPFNSYKCFYGSSKFDKTEMAKLLDEVMNIAVQEGISI